MQKVTLNVVTPQNEDLQMLIRKLDEDLLERYPAEEIFGLDFTDEKVKDILFLVAYDNEIPVGCGAIRPLDEESTELKRFFVDESYRNRGIAKQILFELEAKAKAMHFRSIKLEAGEAQPEALSFYRKHGYSLIDRFGIYVDSESSVCYEKQLQE
ncbi:GNAT family N-acetyltransferase [Bacillus sp. FJAT-26390]|uniref:GNAT family N-acetyltransferase n=1 Tax=Bacillus sp. FJAT-26390 TaxID=1743142 RepID=UPI000807EC9F|nr:GNAT family N-acetyltransferase [Bacillus sp. FJAT-26390]OBZ17042.1 GCN5 family acetyltransferase [Bacillus sp. FJAT-26390]